jgi:transcriptional/translational regulatory protein YebC/TACO1
MAPTSYLFERKGLITLEPTASNPTPTLESLLDISLDHGVEDVRETTPLESDEKTFELVTPLGELSTISTLFSTTPISTDWNVQSSDMSYEPLTPVGVVENEGDDGITEDKAEVLDKLVDALEAEPDVNQVWTNLSA